MENDRVIEAEGGIRMDDLNIILQTARKGFETEDEKFECEMQQQKQEHEARIKKFNTLIKGRTRIASKEDYHKWLKGYLKNGGMLTHSYNYCMNQWVWLVATTDFEISPLYGAESVNIIISEGIKCTGGGRGHTNLFYIDGFTTIGNFAPIFSDTVLTSD